MMPSRLRLASGVAAGVVGLAVAGLILFGTDSLGTGSTVIAVPANPSAVSGTSADTETLMPEDRAEDQAAAQPNRRPWPRPEPTGSATNWRPTYPPLPGTTYRPPIWHEGPRPTWRPPTWGPRPTATRSTAKPRPTTSPTRTVPPSPTATRSSAAPTSTPSATRSSASPTPTPTPSATRSSASPTPSASTASPTPTTASPTPSASSASPTAGTGPYTVRSDWAAAVLDRLNDQRARHGLAALTSNAKLTAAAHTHNVRMADANQLSHQLPGEPGLGSRVSAAGYSWQALGENIAWSSSRSQDGVLALQDAMYNETPPNDGHRRNILSDNFTEIGIDVIEDPEHDKVWLVTDFGCP